MKIPKSLKILIVAIMLWFTAGIPLMARAASFADIFPRLTQKPPVVTQEDIPALIQPGVVRIVNHVTGTINIPAFSIDWNNLVVSLITAAPASTTVDLTLSGSGFVVNSNGYILTNSHVISTAVVKQAYVDQLISAYVVDYALKNAGSKSNKSTSTISQDQLQAFLADAIQYILKRTTGQLTSTVTVLNPSATSTDTVDDLTAQGFPASIVSINDNFLIDGKDVGIIKIDQQNLPALSLGDFASLSTGQSIYAAGFPASADVDVASFMESTITPGSIDAIKPSDTGDFQLIQTDAKVSEGSSGGPLVNSQGVVIGLTTMISDPTAQTGDTFAFGIPVSLAESVLAQNNISYNSSDTYYNHVLNGMALLQNSRCKQAIAEFKSAEQLNLAFPTASYLAPYISQCQSIIVAGQSVDTRLDEVILWSKGGSLWWIWIVIAIIILAGFIIIILRLLKTIRREEGKIGKLENSVGVLEPQDALTKSNTAVTSTVVISPELLAFIKTSRQNGQKDEDIVSKLGQSGWQAKDILAAFESLR